MAGTNQITFTDKVNTRILPIPSQNKVRDVDLNEIKNEHNALDNIVTDPETGLVKVVEDLETNKLDASVLVTNFSDPNNEDVPSTLAIENYTSTRFLLPNVNQIIDNAGVADIVSIYDVGIVQNITFQKSSIFGTESLPIYHFLAASLTGAKHKNNVLVIHSSITTPTILIPAKPPTDLPTYADQATMVADQASQTSGQYYYYTGSTSAWKWNGVLGVVIGDYTERVEVSGWQTWGTMPHEDFVPTWLNITGTYLVGADNINYLDFTYSRITGEVDLVITSRENGNLDPLRVDKLNTLFKLNFNENLSPPLFDGLINESIYAPIVEPEIITPNQASYEDLGGGNYALIGGVNSNTFPTRSEIVINLSDHARYMIDNTDKMSFIFRGETITSGSDNVRVLYSDYSITGGTVRQGIRITIGTGGLLTVRVARANNTNATEVITGGANVIPLDSGQWCIGVTIEILTTGVNIKGWWKSSANAQVFQEIINYTEATNVYSFKSIHDISLDRFDIVSGGGVRPMSKDYTDVKIGILLTASEMEDIFNEID